MRRKQIKNIGYERVLLLIDNALNEKNSDYMMANIQAQLAKTIAKKLRLKLSYPIKQLYCKNCKQFIIPGYNCRVRIGRSRIKAIRITCFLCNHVYRKIISLPN